MNDIEYAVIAAAGFGSRLGKGLPKCMVPIGDQLIIDYILRALHPFVKNIFLVVGYKYEIVKEYCSEKYPFVEIIVNDRFAETNTAYSFSLGCKNIKGKCLFLDGDLILSSQSIFSFLEKAKNVDMLLGITRNITENPVYVEVENNKIIYFSRHKRTLFEWANIFVGDSRILDYAKNYVYEELEKHCPIDCFEIILQEVDTDNDFRRALNFIKMENL